MVWVSGDTETSHALGTLRQILEKRLADHGIMFRHENRSYHCHLTICRFNPVPLRSLPLLNVDTDIRFTAPSLDLAESHLSSTGAEYSTRGSFAFKTSI
jgi:2'-5' RNA ligase